jgi:hypothetical protein
MVGDVTGWGAAWRERKDSWRRHGVPRLTASRSRGDALGGLNDTTKFNRLV